MGKGGEDQGQVRMRFETEAQVPSATDVSHVEAIVWSPKGWSFQVLLVSWNMASWKIPELHGGVHRKITDFMVHVPASYVWWHRRVSISSWFSYQNLRHQRILHCRWWIWWQEGIWWGSEGLCLFLAAGWTIWVVEELTLIASSFINISIVYDLMLMLRVWWAIWTYTMCISCYICIVIMIPRFLLLH